MGEGIFKSKLLFVLLVFLMLSGVFAFFFGLGRPDDSKSSKTSKQENQIFPKNTFAKALLQTNFGNIEIEFSTGTAPLAVNNFIKLAEKSFYNGTLFHRVTKEFIQGGDPLTKEGNKSVYGMGGPGYKFKDEVNPNDKIVRGSVAMANFGPDTNGSQFFIVTINEAPWLNGKHTIFAKVRRGIDVVDKISLLDTSKNNLPIIPVVLEKVILK